MQNKFNVGDTVYTDTHAFHQTTQERLSRRVGKVINNDDPWNIHVNVNGIANKNNPVGFSEFELSLTPITNYKNENI